MGFFQSLVSTVGPLLSVNLMNVDSRKMTTKCMQPYNFSNHFVLASDTFNSSRSNVCRLCFGDSINNAYGIDNEVCDMLLRSFH